jgi:hypothetical protein
LPGASGRAVPSVGALKDRPEGERPGRQPIRLLLREGLRPSSSTTVTGDSDGEPHQLLDIRRQLEDWRRRLLITRPTATQGGIREALYPPCVARKMPAGRPLVVELAGAAVLGWGAQLDQSNLPGTCASSSTR